MAEFKNFVLTLDGQNLLAKALTGKELKFSRVAVGDGSYSGEFMNMTALKNYKYDLEINSCVVDRDAKNLAVIRAVLANNLISAGFYAREIGLFAIDPDDNTEKLYSYANSGNNCDYIPPHTSGDVIEFLFKLQINISNATNITFPAGTGLLYVTHDEINDIVENLQTDINTRRKITDCSDLMDDHQDQIDKRRKITDCNDLMDDHQDQIDNRVKIPDCSDLMDDHQDQIDNRVKIPDCSDLMDDHQDQIDKCRKITDCSDLMDDHQDQIDNRVKIPDCESYRDEINDKIDAISYDFDIGEVKTLDPGSDAVVTINKSATEPRWTFNFDLPAGEKGDKGEKGAKGEKGEKGAKGDSATLNIQSGTAEYTSDIGLQKVIFISFSPSFSTEPFVLTQIRQKYSRDDVSEELMSWDGNDATIEVVFKDKKGFAFTFNTWKNGWHDFPVYIDWLAIEL